MKLCNIAKNSRMLIHMYVHRRSYPNRSSCCKKCRLTISSAIPCAILAMIFAVAGARLLNPPNLLNRYGQWHLNLFHQMCHKTHHFDMTWKLKGVDKFVQKRSWSLLHWNLLATICLLTQPLYTAIPPDTHNKILDFSSFYRPFKG